MNSLKLELFVSDVARSVDFYERVLGFEKVSGEPDGYTEMRSGKAQIDLQSRSLIIDGHPIKPWASERMGLGVEIALDVDDVEGFFKRVTEQKWPISSPLQAQPWGAVDFRILDPDGCYIRVSSG